MLFIETSAKNSYNIDNIFNLLSNNILNKIKDVSDININGIQIRKTNNDKKCCYNL